MSPHTAIAKIAKPAFPAAWACRPRMTDQPVAMASVVSATSLSRRPCTSAVLSVSATRLGTAWMTWVRRPSDTQSNAHAAKRSATMPPDQTQAMAWPRNLRWTLKVPPPSK